MADNKRTMWVSPFARWAMAILASTLIGRPAPATPAIDGDLRLESFTSTVFANTRTLRILVPPAYDAPANRDILVESSGIKVVVDPKSALYVTGSELDFSDALQGGGFKVTNPNAATSCSCGESFSD